MQLPTVEYLCRTFRNEDSHTVYVSRLGLDLFDRLQGNLGIPETVRPLLEVACRLHDVGYSVRPCEHARASAELVLEHGVEGLDEEGLAVVAGAISLHPRKYGAALSNPLVARNPSRELVLKLGALLRIADGLDHGHIQNTSIVDAVCRDDGVHVTVAGIGYGGNVAWARRKADLWEIAFGRGLEIEEFVDEGPSGCLFAGVIGPAHGKAEAARRLLYSQFRAMDENRDGAIAALDPAPLHDLRVANRRFRAVLRLFRRLLGPLGGKELGGRLSGLADRLGLARDLDVWLQFLRSPRLTARMASAPGWGAYVASQQERRDTGASGLGEILQGEESRRAMQDGAFLLRVKLPELLRDVENVPVAPFLARQMKRVFKRLGAVEVGVSRKDPEGMHELRKISRWQRYWAEFAAPVLGDDVQELARRLKDMADALGDVHDADVHITVPGEGETAMPTGLRKVLKRDRRQAERCFVEAWDRLHRKGFCRRLKRALAAHL